MFKQDGKEEYTPEQVQKAKDYALGKNVKKPAAKKADKKPLLPALTDDLRAEPTISLNGGPQVPEAEVQELAEKVRERLTGKPSGSTRPGNIENAKLKSFIERIERLEEEKAGLAQDVKDVFSEAKSNGMDVKTMRQILKLRKMKTSDRTEQEYLLDLYKRALGMQPSFDFEDEEGA